MRDGPAGKPGRDPPSPHSNGDGTAPFDRRPPIRGEAMRRDRLAAVALVLLVGATALSSTGTALAGDAVSGSLPEVDESAALTAQTDGTTLVYDGENVTLEAGQGQAVRGRSDLPAGTTVVVRLRSAGENPFLKSGEAVVDQDGRFRATFDLSDVPAGTTFDVMVRGDDDLASAEGVVVECTDSCESDDSADGSDTRIVRDGDSFELAAGPGQAVSGESGLRAGTRVSVRVRSASAENPFLITAETVVDQDGRFRAVFDLTDVQAGSAFDVVVHRDGSELATAEGEVVECTESCNSGSSDPGTPLPDDELAVRAIVEVDQGKIARIPVGLGDAEAATLVVGGPQVNFVANVTVRDGDGDGRVTVLFDTTAAGHDERTAEAADPDDVASVPVGGETRLDPGQWSLGAGDYPMSLYRGIDATGERVDVGTLVIRDAPSPGNEGSDTEAVTTTPWQGAEFGFEQNIVHDDQGTIVRIPVGLDDADAATLSVGGDDADWTATVTVRDGDDDDSAVVVLFDTTAVGPDARPFSVVDDGDELSMHEGSDAIPDAGNGTVAASDYDLTLYRGASADGEPDDVATLIVEEGLTRNVAETTASTSSEADDPLLGGKALLAAGGVVAVLGIGLLLGLFRR